MRSAASGAFNPSQHEYILVGNSSMASRLLIMASLRIARTERAVFGSGHDGLYRSFIKSTGREKASLTLPAFLIKIRIQYPSAQVINLQQCGIDLSQHADGMSMTSHLYRYSGLNGGHPTMAQRKVNVLHVAYAGISP